MDKSLSWKSLLLIGIICLTLNFFLEGLIGFAFNVIGLISLISGIAELIKHLNSKNKLEKQKIISLFFTQRPETKDKWWHRFFNVLVIGSGTIIFILIIILNINSNNNRWIIYQPTSFSLESNYKESKGQEIPCKSIFGEDYRSFIIHCSGINITDSEAKRYQELYDVEQKKLLKQFGLDKYSQICQNLPINSTEKISCVKKQLSDMNNDPYYSEYQNKLENLASIKISENINFRVVFSDIFRWLIISITILILWFIFWNSIIYRLILYIIFGKITK